MSDLQDHNFYPNGGNYPAVSFPQEIPAPAVDPDEPETILVEYSLEWQQVLLAAVDQLMLYSTWLGDHDAKIEAVNRANLLKWQLTVPAVIDEEVPTPYWDDDSTVDDEMPVDEQEWYGETSNPTAPAGEVTFIQNAVIWLFTGFVAIVAAPALPAGIAAAMAFRTLAVRFTLAFNRGDIAESFRVIIDAEDYGTVDTAALSEGDVVTLNVDGLAEADHHDILIIRTVET